MGLVDDDQIPTPRTKYVVVGIQKLVIDDYNLGGESLLVCFIPHNRYAQRTSKPLQQFFGPIDLEGGRADNQYLVGFQGISRANRFDCFAKSKSHLVSDEYTSDRDGILLSDHVSPFFFQASFFYEFSCVRIVTAEFVNFLPCNLVYFHFYGEQFHLFAKGVREFSLLLLDGRVVLLFLGKIFFH